MDETMSAWRYVRKDTGSNWNSLAMKRDLVRDDCYLNTTMTKWVEESVGLTDHAAVRCKKDFLTALNMYLHKPNKENKQFLNDMFEYNIRHVVMHDKKTDLFLYSVRCIIRKLFDK